MQAVILAAGKGTRLKPFTDTHSKAMAPIAGKPIVHRVIDNISKTGINNFVIVISPDDNEQKAYLESNLKDFNVTLAYQSEQLGMGHALKCASEYINDDFLVSACDTLIDQPSIQNLKDKFETGDCSMVFALDTAPEHKISSYGIVDFDDSGRVKSIIEKPDPKDAPSNKYAVPMYIFSLEFRNYLDRLKLSPREEYEIQDAISAFLEDKGPQPGIFIQERHDLTTMEDLERINKMYKEKSGRGARI